LRLLGLLSCACGRPGQGVQVSRQALELSSQFIVSIRRHADGMAGRADIDAGSVWVSQAHGLAWFEGFRGRLRLRCATTFSIIRFEMWRRIGYVVLLTL
jgi:hypothetical protein